MEEEWLAFGDDDSMPDTFRQFHQAWNNWKNTVRDIPSEQAQAAVRLAETVTVQDLQKLHLVVRALTVVGNSPQARQARERFHSAMQEFLREWEEMLKRLKKEPR